MKQRSHLYLTTQEVAELIGVTKRTLQNWLRDQRVPEPARNPANNYRQWTVQDVENIRMFLKERQLDQAGHL